MQETRVYLILRSQEVVEDTKRCVMEPGRMGCVSVVGIESWKPHPPLRKRSRCWRCAGRDRL